MVRRVRETPLIRPQSVEFVDALMPHQIPLVRLPISILQCKAHSVRCVECVRRVGHIRCVGCAAANFFYTHCEPNLAWRILMKLIGATESNELAIYVS